MEINVRALLVQTIQDKLNQVRYHNRELSSGYLYQNEREHHLKEVDKLKEDIRSDLYSIRCDIEQLEGEYNNLF